MNKNIFKKQSTVVLMMFSRIFSGAPAYSSADAALQFIATFSIAYKDGSQIYFRFNKELAVFDIKQVNEDLKRIIMQAFDLISYQENVDESEEHRYKRWYECCAFLEKQTQIEQNENLKRFKKITEMINVADHREDAKKVADLLPDLAYSFFQSNQQDAKQGKQAIIFVLNFLPMQKEREFFRFLALCSEIERNADFEEYEIVAKNKENTKQQ